MKLTQDQFVEKFGSPAKFSFRGQCYDGRTPTTECICGRKIRFCFIVYTGADQKMVIGSCCFKFFSNARLAEILDASQVYLLNVVVETQKATKRTDDQRTFEESRKRWNKIRREAISRLRAHRKATGKEWLPEDLWDVKMAVEEREPRYRQSSKAAKWFTAKAEYLRTKLAATSIMEHEVTTHHSS